MTPRGRWISYLGATPSFHRLLWVRRSSGPRRLPRGPKRSLRCSQEANKRPQEAPKGPPGGLKRLPRGVRRPPRGSRDARSGPRRPPGTPKRFQNQSEIASGAHRFLSCILHTNSCRVLNEIVTATKSKIVLPCRRELNFDKVVILAFNTDFSYYLTKFGP